MIGLEMSCRHPRVFQLVKTVLVKTDRKRFDRLVHYLRHQSDDRAESTPPKEMHPAALRRSAAPRPRPAIFRAGRSDTHLRIRLASRPNNQNPNTVSVRISPFLNVRKCPGSSFFTPLKMHNSSGT